MRSMYIKNFDLWNGTKKHLNTTHHIVQAKRREVWWCALGVNVGAEIDGKNDTFERPVVIIKRISVETVIVLPLSTKSTSDTHHVALEHDDKTSYAKLSQIRTISTKRLRRKLFTLPEITFTNLLVRLTSYLASQ